MKKYKPHKYQKEFHDSKARFRTFIAGRRGGKSQPLTEPVLTPDGFVSMGSLNVGDIVCTPDGTADVKHIYPQGEQDVYLLTFSDGAQTRASGDHLWKVRFTNAHDKEGIYTTLQLLQILRKEEPKGRRSKNIQVDTPEPVQFEEKELLIDPYILGIIIGDGGITQSTVTFTSADLETVEYVDRLYDVRKTSGDYGYRIISGVNTNKKTGRFEGKKNSIKRHLEALGLMGCGSHNKFIPEDYLHSGIEQRIALLQGLMDSDGYIDTRGHATYYTVNNRLAEQVQWLVRSLGGTATKFDKITKYNGEDVDSYAVYIQFSGDINPAMIERKASRWKPLGIGKLRRRIINIEYVGKEECQCINIGGDGLYITNDFVVTHNSLTGTIEALKIADKSPTHGMIIAPTYGMLKDVNIQMMMEWCPEHAIKSWNRVDMRLELVNGSTITFRSGDNPDRLRGTGKDWIWLDEACFMSKKVWETVYPVLTSTEGIAWVTTTPQGYDWVYQSFYKPAIDGDKNFEAWKFTTLDNPHINKDLVDQARKDLSDVMFKQEYLASFEKFEGLIYPDFSEEKHIKTTPTSLTDIFFVGLDVGWNHPTAGVLMKEDKDRNLFVVDEFREQHLTPDMISNHLNSMLVRNELDMDGVEMFVIDPASKGTQQSSGQSIMDQLREEGWGFIPGNNDVMAGINRLTRLIKEDRFFVAPRCTMFVEEINNYHWKQWDEEKDGYRNRPFKLAEDLMDAARYVAQTRPDYFEHPKLDMYGRIVEEGADPYTGYKPETAGIFDPMGGEIDAMMSDSGIDNLM